MFKIKNGKLIVLTFLMIMINIKSYGFLDSILGKKEKNISEIQQELFRDVKKQLAEVWPKNTENQMCFEKLSFKKDFLELLSLYRQNKLNVSNKNKLIQYLTYLPYFSSKTDLCVIPVPVKQMFTDALETGINNYSPVDFSKLNQDTKLFDSENSPLESVYESEKNKLIEYTKRQIKLKEAELVCNQHLVLNTTLFYQHNNPVANYGFVIRNTKTRKDLYYKPNENSHPKEICQIFVDSEKHLYNHLSIQFGGMNNPFVPLDQYKINLYSPNSFIVKFDVLNSKNQKTFTQFKNKLHSELESKLTQLHNKYSSESKSILSELNSKNITPIIAINYMMMGLYSFPLISFSFNLDISEPDFVITPVVTRYSLTDVKNNISDIVSSKDKFEHIPDSEISGLGKMMGMRSISNDMRMMRNEIVEMKQSFSNVVSLISEIAKHTEDLSDSVGNIETEISSIDKTLKTMGVDVKGMRFSVKKMNGKMSFSGMFSSFF
jgi:hypothetical protein